MKTKMEKELKIFKTTTNIVVVTSEGAYELRHNKFFEVDEDIKNSTEVECPIIQKVIVDLLIESNHKHKEEERLLEEDYEKGIREAEASYKDFCEENPELDTWENSPFYPNLQVPDWDKVEGVDFSKK